MPLTTKGSKIEKAMKAEYGAKRGESVFYASRNAGKISGVDQGRQSTEGHYLRIGGPQPAKRIKAGDIFKNLQQPGVNDGSFVPGARGRR